MGGDVFRDEYSLVLDGTDDYIDCGDANSLSFTTGGFSISSWIKMTDAENFPIIGKGTYSTNGEYQFKVEADKNIAFWVRDASVSSCHIGRVADGTDLANYENQWTHLAGTYDGGTASSGFKIYLNGVQIDSANDQDSEESFEAMENLSANLYIGRYGSAYSEGYISEIVLYSEELSSSQVKTIYNGREPYNHKEGVASSSLTSWWRMGDGTERATGTTVYDMSVNSNNGTMTNMDAADFTGDTP